MALEVLSRPGVEDEYRAKSKFRTAGFTLAVFGIMLAMVTLVANLVAGGLVAEPSGTTEAASILGWSFGLTTTAFGTLKVAIAVVLMGIVLRLWVRVDAVKAAVARLKPTVSGLGAAPVGAYDSDCGQAIETNVSARDRFAAATRVARLQPTTPRLRRQAEPTMEAPNSARCCSEINSESAKSN
jgi:hypothetical protein